MATIRDFHAAIKIVQGIGSKEETDVIGLFQGRCLVTLRKAEAQLKLEASHAWTVREAFVCLFAPNPGFDADWFRNECGPVAKRHKAES